MIASSLRVLHISQTDIESGAGREAYRLHGALCARGISSRMLVASSRTSDHLVISAIPRGVGRIRSDLARYYEASLHFRGGVKSGWVVSPAWGSVLGKVRKHELYEWADIIVLRWVNGGFLRPEDLVGINKPIIWVLSDVWPFTGGCHYPGSCRKFVQLCANCPALTRPSVNDNSKKLWLRKKGVYSKLNLTVVAPSRWMERLALESSLFQEKSVLRIATGIDLERYKMLDRDFARAALNLPKNRRLVLFGALGAGTDKRKGGAELASALERLKRQPSLGDVELVVFGQSAPAEECSSYKTHYLGVLSDDAALCLAYCSVDVFVAPSLQENLANTVLEALACGVPVVAFDIGGMGDAIRHKETGYLATAGDIDSLSVGIQWALEVPDRRLLSDKVRRHCEGLFNIADAANSYELLMRQLLRPA